MSSSHSRIRPSGPVLLVLAGAFTFFLIGSWWGAPVATGPDRVHGWGVDDDTPLGPLTQMHEIVRPQPEPWLSYPLLHSFILAAAYAPYFLLMLVTGGFSGPEPVFPFGLADPVGSLRVLSHIAHVESAVMAAVAAASAAWIARRLWHPSAGWLYAALVTSSFPLVYYARVGNVDATALAFVLLSVAAFVVSMEGPLTVRRAAWLGVAVGCALATKESSIGLFLPMPVLLVWRWWRHRPAGEAWTVFWRPALIGAAVAVVAFGAGSGLFVAPARFFAHVAYLRDLMALVARADVGHPFAFPFTAAGHAGYMRATAAKFVDGMTLAGLVLAAVGVALAVIRRDRSWMLVWLPICYVVYLFATYRLVQVRYLMPAMILLMGFAAFAMVELWRSPRLLSRAVGLALTVAVLGQQSLVAADYTYQMLRDSRYNAGRWLMTHARPGDTLAYFGPSSTLPPLPAHLLTERATDARGMYWVPRWDDAKVQEIRAAWDAKPPTFIITMPDYTSHGLPHSHSLPPRLYAALDAGQAGFGQIALFHTRPLFAWMPMPMLDYPVVNPPIRLFAPLGSHRTRVDHP